MKKLLSIALLAIIVISCDQVQDEVAVFNDVSTESLKYHLNSEPVMIPIYGDFEHGAFDVLSSSGSVKLLRTDRKNTGVTFLQYTPNGKISDSFELQLVEGNRIIGEGSVEVRKIDDGIGVVSAISKDYKMGLGDNDFKIDFLSEMSYNLEAPNEVDYRVIPVGDSYGALLTRSKNEDGKWDIQLNFKKYCGGPGVGRQEFVIELCLEPKLDAGRSWIDPIKNCGTYTSALTSFTFEQ